MNKAHTRIWCLLTILRNLSVDSGPIFEGIELLTGLQARDKSAIFVDFLSITIEEKPKIDENSTFVARLWTSD